MEKVLERDMKLAELDDRAGEIYRSNALLHSLFPFSSFPFPQHCPSKLYQIDAATEMPVVER